MSPRPQRRKELVFFGVALDEALIRQRISASLMADSELRAVTTGKERLSDPFPNCLAQNAARRGERDQSETTATLLGELTQLHKFGS